MLLYNIGIRLYALAIALASLFNSKAKQLRQGRSESLSVLNRFVKKEGHQVAWFHCASLGEFEQARPIIERLKSTRQHLQIAVSFFSPSGYEVRKNYAYADVVFYLPGDTPAHARKVMDCLQPDIVAFVKYEIWLNYIREISRRRVPLYLISATFRPGHIYFKWYGRMFKKALLQFNKIFTQDVASSVLLEQHDIPQCVFSNDTRYDRVFDASKTPKDLPVISRFKGNDMLLVGGSSYIGEEKIVAAVLGQFPELKVVMAPHNIGASRIAEIEQTFAGFDTIKYSEANDTNVVDKRVLIVDNIGLLSSIYRYGDMAVIGGGFGSKGIHNTLEAAAFGMPVFVGPLNHERFPETTFLKQAGVLFTITDEATLKSQLNRFVREEGELELVKQKALHFIRDNTGATEVVVGAIGNF